MANACILVKWCDITVLGERRWTNDHLHWEQKKILKTRKKKKKKVNILFLYIYVYTHIYICTCVRVSEPTRSCGWWEVIYDEDFFKFCSNRRIQKHIQTCLNEIHKKSFFFPYFPVHNWQKKKMLRCMLLIYTHCILQVFFLWKMFWAPSVSSQAELMYRSNASNLPRMQSIVKHSNRNRWQQEWTFKKINYLWVKYFKKSWLV